jgi:hypothetical protein
MGKWMGWVLMVVLASGGVAYGSGKKHGGKFARWEVVERLRPGTEIDVLAEDEAGPEPCLVSSVDDGALTCLREDPATDTRLVFPRSAVQEVRVWEVAPNRHIGLWIGMGIGFAIGGLMCAEGGAGPIVICGMLGAALVGAAVSGDLPARPGWYPGWPAPAPPQRPQRMRWRLVYRGATP